MQFAWLSQYNQIQERVVSIVITRENDGKTPDDQTTSPGLQVVERQLQPPEHVIPITIVASPYGDLSLEREKRTDPKARGEIAHGQLLSNQISLYESCTPNRPAVVGPILGDLIVRVLDPGPTETVESDELSGLVDSGVGSETAIRED